MVSAGALSKGVCHWGCLICLPNHILEGDISPGFLGVSIQNDHAEWKLSPIALHFSHNLLKVFTAASARPLDWGWLTLDCLWMMPFSAIQALNSAEVKTPSPSLASMAGQVDEWNHLDSLSMTDAEVGADGNSKYVAHPDR